MVFTVVELFGPGWRTFMSYMYQVWVAVGVLLIGSISYFVRYFVYLQYILIAPGIICTVTCGKNRDYFLALKEYIIIHCHQQNQARRLVFSLQNRKWMGPLFY